MEPEVVNVDTKLAGAEQTRTVERLCGSDGWPPRGNAQGLAHTSE